MRNEPAYSRLPKVPIERRAAAFVIDFMAVGVASWLFRGNALGISLSQLIVFSLGWVGLRVFLVVRNQGQSLGRWALDMKLVDARFGKTPGLVELSKREGMVGFCALLVVIGFNIGLAHILSFLLLISPLAADCGLALSDSLYQQAFHDRWANTRVIATRRGWSLDLRVKKLLAQVSRRMK
jgi:uncharacterized RDD family membrane protein YckC